MGTWLDDGRWWTCFCRFSRGAFIRPDLRCYWCHRSKGEAFVDLFGGRLEKYEKAVRLGKAEHDEAVMRDRPW